MIPFIDWTVCTDRTRGKMERKILIVDDDPHQQKNLLTTVEKFIAHSPVVEISCVPGAVLASSVIKTVERVHLIILDHDMPAGNGADLIKWMGNNLEPHMWPVIITASGIHDNNERMKNLAEAFGMEIHQFKKSQVISGMADHVIERVIYMETRS